MVLSINENIENQGFNFKFLTEKWTKICQFRDLNSLIEYLQSEIESPIVKLNNSNDMTNVDVKYDYLIGHFVDSNSKSFEIFSKIANLLRDQCHFAVSFDNSSKEFVYYRSNEVKTFFFLFSKIQL